MLMPVKYFILIAFFMLFQPSAALSEVSATADAQNLYPLFEKYYLLGLDLPYEEASAAMDSLLAQGETLLLSIERSSLTLLPEKLDELTVVQIKICGRAAADKRFATKAFTFIQKVRRRIPRVSKRWPWDNEVLKRAFYRTLDTGRLVSEELLIRLDGMMLSPLVKWADVSSLTPYSIEQGVKVHSGDILISGGGGLVPLFITRGNTRPGKYSRSAIIYVDEATGKAWVLTVFPFRGTVKMTLSQYLERSNYSAMLLRLSPSMARLQEDPLLPHKAASFIFNKIEAAPFSYDHEMNWKDNRRLFSEEMILMAYESICINLWSERTGNDLPGLGRWLGFLGLSGSKLLPPSELEYDRNLIPLFEWFNPDALRAERLTFAVIDTLTHSAGMGAEPGYAYDEVPLAFLAKTWSLLDSYRGRKPSVPDGLSPFEALRIRTLTDKIIPLIKEDIRRRAHWFKEEKGRYVNYRELQTMAEKVLQERRGDLEGIFKTYEAEMPARFK